MVTGITSNNTMTANVMGTTPLPNTQAAAPPTTANMKPAIVKSDRRSNKPIMEKRRRARINNCLNELKTLILDATKKDPARHSKLEKADILEKTVKHLQDLQRQQTIMQQATDPKIMNKFKAGFADCVNEVNRFPGLEPSVKRRLLLHLNNCITGVKTELHHHQRQIAIAPQQTQQLNGHILSPPSTPEQDQNHHQQQQQQQQQQTTINTNTTPYMLNTHIQYTPQGYFLQNGMQVIPTKLSNGSIALVLPQQQQQQQQQQHNHHQQQQQQQYQQQQHNINSINNMQTPSRTASTGSASSHSSQQSNSYERLLTSPNMHTYAPPSPANSYEAMDCKPSPTVIQHASSYVQFQQQQQQQQQLIQQHHQQQQQQLNNQPLSLVVRKEIKEEEQPWRPW